MLRCHASQSHRRLRLYSTRSSRLRFARTGHLYRPDSRDSPGVRWERKTAPATGRMTTCLDYCRSLLRRALLLRCLSSDCVRSLKVLDCAVAVPGTVVDLVSVASFSRLASDRRPYRDTCRHLCLRLRSQVPLMQKRVRVQVRRASWDGCLRTAYRKLSIVCHDACDPCDPYFGAFRSV
jgi:hypothetical protein